MARGGDLDFDPETDVEPTTEPEEEPTDDHRRIPLDNDEDGRYLDRDDPRRAEAEKRLGRLFDQDEEV